MGRRVLLVGLLALGVAQAEDLAAFLSRGKQVRAGGGLLRILHFGDSHLAAPSTRRAYRQTFQSQFGNGGSGLGLPWVDAPSGITASASRGWRKALHPSGDACLGLGGRFMETRRAGEWARLEGTFSRLRLHFLRAPGAGSVRVLLDGQDLGAVSLAGAQPGLELFDRRVGAGRHRLEILSSQDGPVRVLGVSLEGATGAAYSPLAFNGADLFWMEAPGELLLSQLRAEAPDMVILAFGTNEANGPRFDPGAYRHHLEAFLGRFRKAVPEAAMVLLGPPDARLPRGLPGSLDQVIAVQQAVASRVGALFFDQREAMGGAGSIGSWQRSGMAARDGVHLTPQGYDRLAGLVAGRLFEGVGLPMAVRERPPVPEASEAPEVPQGLFLFRTEDGRTIITDRASVVADQRGKWIGRKPQ